MAEVNSTAQARRFLLDAASDAAVQHSIPHRVVSQVLHPDMAAFMPNSRIWVRSRHDELCCVGTAKSIPDVSGLSPADIEYLDQLPHLTRLVVHNKAMDAAGVALVQNLTQLQHLDLGWCEVDDVAPLAAVAKLTQLQHLTLTRCDGVDAAALAGG